MTTLGFGDIHAKSDSTVGQLLLMVQVILGYIILGALITYLSVLFNSDGPADLFEEEKISCYRKLWGWLFKRKKMIALIELIILLLFIELIVLDYMIWTIK